MALQHYADKAVAIVDGRMLGQQARTEAKVYGTHTLITIESAVPVEGVEWDAKVGDRAEVTVAFAGKKITVKSRVMSVGIGWAANREAYQIIECTGLPEDWT